MKFLKSVLVLTVCLFAGLLLAASPAEAKRAKDFNDAQIKLLFSGTEVAGEGSCMLHYPGVLTLDFTFHKDGRFFVDYTCAPTASAGDAGNTTGTWSIEENELCMVFKYPGMGWENEIRGNCYSVRHDRSGFGAYSSVGRFLELTFKHHRFPTKGKLLTAVLNLSDGGTKADAGAPDKALLAEIDRLTLEAEEARQALEARKVKEVKEAEIRKKNAEKEQLQIAELKRKKEEEKLRLAALEKEKQEEATRLQIAELKRKKEAEVQLRLAVLEKKKEDAARRETAELKRKKDEQARLAAKATTDKKRQGGKQSLRERMAALKDLKDAGLLSEEEFQANKVAVLNEFLGIKGASTTASKNTPAIKVLSSKFADVKFGNYHALVFGANEYKFLPKLQTAVNDAKVVAETLRDDYGFKVKLILNPSRGDILNALDEFREKLGDEDNLLIYYAGHGFLDEEAGRGYWLPVDAKPNRRYGWVSNATLTDTLKTLQAKHVMVVADSCFSGTLTRGVKVGVRSGDYYKRMAEKWTRVALVSGGLEPVADSGGGGHSPFAKAFINVLKENNEVIDGTQLFSKLRRPVAVSTQQTPEYSDVRNAGHDGGDFLFVRKK